MDDLLVPRCYLGTASLAAGNGGICRVARLMAKVLVGEASADRLRCDGVALHDTVAPRDISFKVRAERGSQLRVLYDAWRAAFRHTHFIYDFAGTARAHCGLPGLR